MFNPLQGSVAAALLDPDAPVPAGIVGEARPLPQKRFAVYRNNVVHGLISALRTRFPVVERIVGAEFFTAMARTYVAGNPPRSKLMAEYGEDLAGFIVEFAPARTLPYLPDVARLEVARTLAYHAADAAPLHADRLAGIDADALASLRLSLHPSLQIVRSRHPIVTIWAMNAGERPLAPVDDTVAEDALVVRPFLTVELRALPAGGAAFILALAAGATMRAAVETAVADGPAFDLPGNLAGLLTSGLVTGLIQTGEHEDCAR